MVVAFAARRKISRLRPALSRSVHPTKAGTSRAPGSAHESRRAGSRQKGATQRLAGRFDHLRLPLRLIHQRRLSSASNQPPGSTRRSRADQQIPSLRIFASFPGNLGGGSIYPPPRRRFRNHHSTSAFIRSRSSMRPLSAFRRARSAVRPASRLGYTPAPPARGHAKRAGVGEGVEDEPPLAVVHQPPSHGRASKTSLIPPPAARAQGQTLLFNQPLGTRKTPLSTAPPDRPRALPLWITATGEASFSHLVTVARS